VTAATRLSGPAGSLVLGNLPDFARDPLSFLEHAAREHGPVARLRFGRTRAVLLNSPELIEEVLVKRRDSFIKARPLRAMHRLFGNGLLTNEGESWRKQRKLAQPAFSAASMEGHSAIVTRRAAEAFDGYTEGQRLDVHESMKHLMMTIIAESLFGADVAEKAAAIGLALEATMDQYAARRGLARFAPDWVPLAHTRRYVAGVETLEKFVNAVSSSRKRDAGRPADLMSMLLAARDEDGQPMSDTQLRDEAITLFVGGFDTPALAMSWTWYLLSRNEHASAKLAAEVDNALDGRTPSFADVERLQYTQRVIKESMRLYPPAWILSREASEDTSVGGFAISKGTTVMMSPWVTHRDPGLFADSLRFCPDRWLPAEAGKIRRFAYFPFGGGPRVCIGASFATMETTLLLSMLAQRFQFVVEGNADIVPRASMTLRPRGGVPVRIRRR
jgi:cytochrome P450